MNTMENGERRNINLHRKTCVLERADKEFMRQRDINSQNDAEAQSKSCISCPTDTCITCFDAPANSTIDGIETIQKLENKESTNDALLQSYEQHDTEQKLLEETQQTPKIHPQVIVPQHEVIPIRRPDQMKQNRSSLRYSESLLRAPRSARLGAQSQNDNDSSSSIATSNRPRRPSKIKALANQIGRMKHSRLKKPLWPGKSKNQTQMT